MAKVIDHMLVSRDEIEEFCARIGKQITQDYEGSEVYFIGVLKGSFMFLADLVRHVKIPCVIDFMSVSSYSGEKSTGVVQIHKDIDYSIEGKNVIIVEDIVDTGLTLSYLKNMLQTRNPASIRICTAFDKPSQRTSPIHIDYVGKVIPNEFIVGYGLDLDARYRNIPDVVVLADEEENEAKSEK